MEQDPFEKLNDAVKNCARCRLAETRTRTAFGEGNVHAKVMLVGEGPGPLVFMSLNTVLFPCIQREIPVFHPSEFPASEIDQRRNDSRKHDRNQKQPDPM